MRRISRIEFRKVIITELRINKGTPYLSFMGRGDFSRPDIGRLKPPLPQEITPKISSITFTKLNSRKIE
jgi:hypothetical protein